MPPIAIGPDGHLDDESKAEIDAQLEQGEDHVRIEHEGSATWLGDLGELKPDVETFVEIDVDGDVMTPQMRAKLDEELDRLGIDRTEIDAKLDRGEKHIHIERDSPS